MGARGRVPKPTAVKKREGTYRKDRAAKNEVQPIEGAPPCPKWLQDDDDAAQEWARVVPLLLQSRILSETDLAVLANYCEAWSLSVKATRAYHKDGIWYRRTPGSSPGKHPMIKVAQEARAQTMQLGAQLGLSPAARSRVSVPEKPKKDDPTEGFLFGSKPTLVKTGTDDE